MAQTPDEFAAELTAIAGRVASEVRDVVDDAGKSVRNASRRNAQAANPVHARGVDKFINYDVEAAGTTIRAEIGYDKRGLGNLGAILEYANGGAQNSPQRNLGRAMDVEEPLFQRRLADIGERLLT